MLYFILSLITLFGSMSWTPVKSDNTRQISQYFINSGVVKDYGEESLIRQFVNLNSDIFSGGCKVMIPKGATIVRGPENLKLIKQPVKMANFDWYTALYEDGDLKYKWNDMKSHVYSKLGIGELASINTENLKTISKKIPELQALVEKPEKGMQISSTPPNDKKAVERAVDINMYKVYTSFIIIETDAGEYKVLPVILRLNPEQELENRVTQLSEEVTEK